MRLNRAESRGTSGPHTGLYRFHHPLPSAPSLINALEKLSGVHSRTPNTIVYNVIIRARRFAANADKDIHYRGLPVFEFR